MAVSGLRWSVFACSMLVLVAPARAGGLNQKVLNFSKENIGKQVGDGDCFTFAATAMKTAGAKLDFKPDPGPGDAVWGERIYTLEIKNGALVETKAMGQTVKPGDIIQFRDTTFARAGYFLSAIQHSAVVSAVGTGGKELTVLHQNWNNKRTVHQTVFRLTDLKKGWVRIYRPIAP